MVRQEEEAEQGEAAAAAAASGTGEHPCHRSAYNRRLRASQSPNDNLSFCVSGIGHP